MINSIHSPRIEARATIPSGKSFLDLRIMGLACIILNIELKYVVIMPSAFREISLYG